MSSRTRLLVFLVSTPLVVLVAVGGIVGARTPAQRAGAPLRVFEDVIRYILGAYVEEVNIDKVMDGAMRGLADGLDPSSAYLTPAEAKSFTSASPAPAGEVGLVMTRQFYLRVIGVRDGSPADRAGLQTGDFVRAINGIATRDMSALTGNRLLRGEPGSKISLLVIRGNAADPHTIDLVREAPKGEAVTSRKLPGGEAFVRVASFGSATANALRTTIGSLGPAANTGVLIDLRGVADGTPEDGIAAARLFVKSGVIATLAGRAESSRTVTSAQAGDGALAMPVTLLVSNGTAHAAEVFASALSANKRAQLVGEPTAGLAAVQRLVRLPDGHALWMTHSRYLQADGTPIHERGLRPDEAVEIPVIGFDEAKPTTDQVLTAAVKALRSMILQQGKTDGSQPGTPR